ncbi:hypothetical protein [Kordiimonas sp.]|uniref:hypothetical protein n=1 Tax=Kordiimonas sp. TaxID=1970157 RepID=UPI003A92A14F
MMVQNTVLITGADTAAGRVFAQALEYEKSVHLITLPDAATGIGAPTHSGTRLSPLASHGSDAMKGMSDLLSRHEVKFIIPAGEVWPGVLVGPVQVASAPAAAAPVVPALKARVVAPVPAAAEGDNGDPTYLCFTDRQGGLVYCGLVERSPCGTRLSHVSATTKVRDAAAALAGQRELRGAWAMSMAGDRSGESRLVAVTPAALAAHRLFGANLTLLALFDMQEKPVSVLPAMLSQARFLDDKPFILGAWKTVYLDLDDTLIVHGKVHSWGIRFLENARKHQIKVRLITRHYQQPERTLADFAIPPSYFDQIIWLENGEPKSSVMTTEETAIFIDDSFKERQEVMRERNLPAFAPDLLPALMRR